MAGPLTSLWPTDIEQADVLTPLSIMRFQAEELEKRTHGRLKAVIESKSCEKNAVHYFDLVAPLLHQYRYRLFSVVHSHDYVYPATVCSSVFPWYDDSSSAVTSDSTMSDDFDDNTQRGATTQDQFAELIAVVLQSGQTRSVIQSLLARMNEIDPVSRPKSSK